MSKKWQKFLKNYVLDRSASGFSRIGSTFDTLTMPLLREVFCSEVPVAAVLPDARQCDLLAADIEAVCRVLQLDLKCIVMPECGRGKLLFPGGENRRARALDALLAGDCKLLIGSVHSLLGPAQKPREVRESSIQLQCGMELPMASLVENLVKLDYDDEYEATVSGEFARRGGIIDVFSPAHDAPCRIEFFGDTIDTMRLFDPATQRSTGNIDSYRIIGRSGITAGGEADSDVFAYFEEQDWKLVAFHPAESMEKLEKYASGSQRERFRTLLQEKQEKVLFFDDAEYPGNEGLPGMDISGILDDAASGNSDDENIRTAAGGMLENYLLTKLRAAAAGELLFLTDDSESEEEIRAWCARRRISGNRISFAPFSLSSGFQISGISVITVNELARAGFSRQESIFRQKEESADAVPVVPPGRQPREEFALADLESGDYAVHIDHGIGIFRGFKQLTSNGITREVLAVEYRDGKILYVPLLQAHKLSRYLGAAGKVPLHTLGGKRWDKDKEEARQGVRSYAAEMLRMQAMRQAVPGISFRSGSAIKSFIRSFPFEDTPDQKYATAEIRRDMASSRPMDRLLCGDVGYGKTEIAMRAAFTAVAAGYQVAVLAPTTVLVQQHYKSFCSRFAGYPVNIAELSRFRSAREQQQTLDQLRRGGVDIVIGTHRICADSIRFKNLGLVVIDEEQRFGVNHKERLRRFRAEADVLAMSATPIPRTLYLAMAGARDLSTLTTAPKLRLPVRTVILPEDDKLIVTAINNELARGGQVFFLHNRVKTIEDKAEKLRSLVPGAVIGVAHGQMPEHQLEEAMAAFISGKTQVLVCSTIIESGLDVPNANTMIIDRADRFGLAELYQLRGRVGRWKNQAYAYLLLPKNQLVSTDARKRLAAIRRCSSQGAGFQLALRDLEIRGSGNLLGAEQSGHLNLIGFDLYCHLLKQEVEKLKGRTIRFLPETEIAIDFISFAVKGTPKEMLAAFFPAEYIGGERLRLDMYRKLAALESQEELDSFSAELADRFGPLPEESCNLLEYTRLRIALALSGYRRLSVVNGKVMLCNPGGTIYRDAMGRQPVLDKRDSAKLRLKQLFHLVSDAKLR